MSFKKTRQGYADALIELAEEIPELIVLDADVSKATQTCDFAAIYPDRFINCGVQEQNMLCVAAGFALEGFIPFASTFGVFATARAGDQLRNAIAYPQLNVKIGATHCGITTGGDGASHQANEDIATTRALPNLTVLVPGDYEEAKTATFVAAQHKGPVYLRLGRDAYPVVPEIHGEIQIGKSKLLREGTDATIIVTGILVGEALEAHEILLNAGISTRVIHMPSIKPIDKKAIIKAATETGCIVTIEEHSIIGGLGDAVSAVATESYPVFVSKIGIPDVFGESGTAKELLDKFKLRAKHLKKEVITLVSKKGK